jgi:hypothetical protein
MLNVNGETSKMKFNKLALVAAVSAAVGGGSGIANAQVTGDPGEALLVPLVLSGANENSPIQTYVGLYVPETIGQDTVINRYTAPHVAPEPGYPTVTQNLPADAEIYWVLWDENSVKVADGYCQVSTGDKTVWTTDPNYRLQQLNQRQGISQAGVQGIPDPVCGPSVPVSHRFGYVTFQTVAGADGYDADFAFWGNAWILDGGVISSTGSSIAAVPVIPMADGYDTSSNEEPSLGNEVISSGTLHQTPPVAQAPSAVAPIAAGIRMNNADGDDDEQVVLQAEIRGPLTGNEMSLHVFWFDKNNADRDVAMDVWDDQEGTCSTGWKLPRELNLVLYNFQIALGAGFGNVSAWGNLVKGVPNTVGAMTDLIDAVQPSTAGYTSGVYCLPPYWQPVGGTYPGALNGYVQYSMQEEGVGVGANVNEAAVAFNWQESLAGAHQATGVASGWSTHMTTDLGKQ